jgi:uncharacterized membrane protein YuzA (DUF378 family)
MNKTLETGVILLAGVAAVNVGLTKFVNIDLLSYTTGMVTTIAVGAIAVSGAVLLWQKYQNKI